MGAWARLPASSMAGHANGDAQTEALLVETRRRAGRIDRYVDMIPARFYLSSEALQAHKPRNGLDPAQYKPTSQLLAEVTAAAASAASAGSSSQGASKKKKAKKQGTGATADEGQQPSSRAELRKLLERRIAELKEERRKKQSDADREKNKAAGEKRVREEADNSAAKKQRPQAKAPSADDDEEDDEDEEDVQAGRLSFEPRLSELPFEAQINRRGNKVRQLRGALRKEEAKMRKLGDVEEEGEREALRSQFALDTALRRARGEKVHNDVSRLRKVQKQLETRKTKGKEKWEQRVEVEKKAAEDKQRTRKENLQAQRLKKKKGRAGFEGKGGFLNKEE